MRASVVPIVVGALGAVSTHFKMFVKRLDLPELNGIYFKSLLCWELYPFSDKFFSSQVHRADRLILYLIIYPVWYCVFIQNLIIIIIVTLI